MKKLHISAGLAGLSLAAALSVPAFAELPGGANSLNETYQDWQVNCVSGEKGVQCAMTQKQLDKDSGRTVLSLELMSTQDGILRGVIVMPFGLAVTQGATVSIDDQTTGKKYDFSTCLPQGCLVPVSLDKDMIDKMKSGTKLNVSGTVVNNGKTVTIAASLSGFTAAMNRLGVLKSAK
ncbi:invasion associated locus B family protein [Martelella sp. HB161492]|uniref:invasion associated locus B family protein n=1 Tax=Martelella sp. HB161492 TaxID=2720726 RepID=UPI0015919F4E|nr:invasion associated locus B family protein [Martelella sp. HB161492]